MDKIQKGGRLEKFIDKVIQDAIINGHHTLIEGGSIRLGYSKKELKIMTQVIREDLEAAEVLGLRRFDHD